MPAMKVAMKAKVKVALETLRAVKAELMTAETASGSTGEVSNEDEIKLLMKMIKQRKDAAAIYIEQERSDLAEDERIKDIQVLDDDRLLILIEKNQNIKGAIYNINKNSIIRTIDK